MKLNAHYARSTSFGIVVIVLVALIALLGGMLYVVFAKAASAEPRLQGYLMRLAWLTGAALFLSILILLGVVVRYVASRLTDQPEPFKPTGYRDVWTEAGRRLKAEDAPPIEPFEQEDS